MLGLTGTMPTDRGSIMRLTLLFRDAHFMRVCQQCEPGRIMSGHDSSQAPSGNTDNRKIAGDRTCRVWVTFKQSLENGRDAPAWRRAAQDYFHARIDAGYLQPVEAIQNKQSKMKGEGFAIVAILCSLIEFLEATVRGLKYVHGVHKKELAPFEYSDNKKLFVDFLRKREPFQQEFTAKKIAESFYVFVRCGLLHEAATKGEWLIRSSGSKIIEQKSNGEWIVYHRRFYSALYEFIKWYETRLTTDADFQAAFIRKFDSLCS
jgi:hypothetical protein